MTDYSYKDRVKREHDELGHRVTRLSTFMGTTVHDSLPKEEQSRLSDQLYHMEQYHRLLHERIFWFGTDEAHPVDDDPCGR